MAHLGPPRIYSVLVILLELADGKATFLPVSIPCTGAGNWLDGGCAAADGPEETLLQTPPRPVAGQRNTLDHPLHACLKFTDTKARRCGGW